MLSGDRQLDSNIFDYCVLFTCIVDLLSSAGLLGSCQCTGSFDNSSPVSSPEEQSFDTYRGYTAPPAEFEVRFVLFRPCSWFASFRSHCAKALVGVESAAEDLPLS